MLVNYSMLKKLGKLNYLIKNKEITLNLNEVKTGVNIYENFIIFKMNNKIKIFDRKCDHAGGKIISKDGNPICGNLIPLLVIMIMV